MADPHLPALAEAPSLAAAPTKAALRRAALAARAALDDDARARAAARLAETTDLPSLAPGAVVAGYWPIRDEIDPRPLMLRLALAGARLALPVVADDGERLIFRAWTPETPLEPAAFGLSVPPAGAEELTPRLLLVPLAAFDAAGHRIGYGKGHYDRALARLDAAAPTLAVGLAFAVQQVAAVPAEPHDRPLDLVLTDAGPLRPAAQSAKDPQ